MIFMMFGSIVTLDGGYIPYIPFIYPVMYNPWFIYKPNKQPGFVFFSRAHYFPNRQPGGLLCWSTGLRRSFIYDRLAKIRGQWEDGFTSLWGSRIQPLTIGAPWKFGDSYLETTIFRCELLVSGRGRLVSLWFFNGEMLKLDIIHMLVPLEGGTKQVSDLC